jgi:hypothetical protein
MSALVGKEIPTDGIAFQVFGKTYELIVVGIQIRWILMGPRLSGFIGRQFVPLLAGHLATPARRTPGRIDQK